MSRLTAGSPPMDPVVAENPNVKVVLCCQFVVVVVVVIIIIINTHNIIMTIR